MRSQHREGAAAGILICTPGLGGRFGAAGLAASPAAVCRTLLCQEQGRAGVSEGCWNLVQHQVPVALASRWGAKFGGPWGGGSAISVGIWHTGSLWGDSRDAPRLSSRGSIPVVPREPPARPELHAGGLLEAVGRCDSTRSPCLPRSRLCRGVRSRIIGVGKGCPCAAAPRPCAACASPPCFYEGRRPLPPSSSSSISHWKLPERCFLKQKVT